MGLERLPNTPLHFFSASYCKSSKIQWGEHSESSLGSNYILSAGCLHENYKKCGISDARVHFKMGSS